MVFSGDATESLELYLAADWMDWLDWDYGIWG